MTPVPVPAGYADMLAYLTACIDNGWPLGDGLYEYAGTLTITQHGRRLIGAGLPSRQSAGSQGGGYGTVLRQTGGVGPAIVVGAPGAYISNIELAGLRVESAGQSAIQAFNPATCVFRDLSRIGTGGNRAVLHISGGIQSTVENVEVSGMGYPEFAPHGDFALRAAWGVLIDGGTDEWGNPTLGNCNELRRLYVHQCRTAILNDNGNTSIGGNTVIEECLRALECGATSRTRVDGLYWESVAVGPQAGGYTPIKLGSWASLYCRNMEGMSGDAQAFVDGDGGDGVLALLIGEGCHLKGTAPLLGNLKRLDNGPTQGWGMITGASLPAGMDKGWLTMVVDTRGSGR